MKLYIDSYDTTLRNSKLPSGGNKQFKFFAYKNGKCLGEFHNEYDAVAASTIVEKVCTNQDEFDTMCRIRNEAKEIVYQNWIRSIISELIHEYGVSNDLVDKAIKSLEGFEKITYESSDFIDLLDERVRLLKYLDS